MTKKAYFSKLWKFIIYLQGIKIKIFYYIWIPFKLSKILIINILNLYKLYAMLENNPN